MDSVLDTIIGGGGISGLTCARELTAAGLSCQLLEASDQVGGRARTDKVDGFLLDRGFQVFLTAYPEAQAILSYDELELKSFEPGALIRFQGKFRRLADPWRQPRHLLATALSPVASLQDKLRIASFRRHTTRGKPHGSFERPEQTTIDLLRSRGFSEIVIERFFRPFLGGIFLDRDLATSSRMCECVFRMFSLGDATLPAQGMGAIARQLASQLPADVVNVNSPVVALDRQAVVLSSGEKLTARAVILATEAPVASKLLGDNRWATGQSVTNLYFAADEAPIKEPILVLNGDGEGPINNLCVREGVFVCGDYLDTASINGAMASGRRAAEAVLTDLQ